MVLEDSAVAGLAGERQTEVPSPGEPERELAVTEDRSQQTKAMFVINCCRCKVQGTGSSGC